ncbi:ATP-binding cassette domain-containing protein [Gorillibacterium sp. sgz500922]|uniref:ATP-binding cassette domain-containing protein n=1 Tax=Gorillibacterium sp. sgz500922 TaxID=3446694 RepID=UPI003F6702A2
MIRLTNVEYDYQSSLFPRLRKRQKGNTLSIPELVIPERDRHALIGNNGAGKSTLLKMIMGIIKPTRGQLTVGGIEPWKSRIRHVQRLGVVWGNRSTLWWDIPVVDSLRAVGSIYGVEKPLLEKRIEDYVEKFHCQSFIHQSLRNLSLGQRVKSEMIGALLHSPDLLILDEPFIGLDFASRHTIITELNEIVHKGNTTLLLTSHNIEDIELLARTITVLDRGSIVTSGDKDAIIRQLAKSSQIHLKKRSFEPFRLPGPLMEKFQIVVEANETNTDIKLTAHMDEADRDGLMEEIFHSNSGITEIGVGSSLQDAAAELIRKNNP